MAPKYRDLQPASLRMAGVDLFTVFSRFSAVPTVYTALLPAVRAEQFRAGHDRAGVLSLLLVSGGASCLFSDTPFDDALLDSIAPVRGVPVRPLVTEIAGELAVVCAMNFAREFEGQLSASVSESFTI